MSPEQVIIAVLLAVLIGQQVYWSRIFMQMTNKLMSRNYFEYVQTEKVKNQPLRRPQVQDDDLSVDPHSERMAQQLNSLFNAV